MKPLLTECLELQKNFTTIPVSAEMYADSTTPILLLNTLRASSLNVFLLESVEGSKKWGRYSFLGFDPVKTLAFKNTTDNPLAVIRESLKKYKSPTFSYLPPFTGGFVGYFGYDSVKYFEKAIHLTAEDTLHFDDLKLMLFDKIICFDHFTQKITVMLHIATDDLERHYEEAEQQIKRIQHLIKNTMPLNSENPVTGTFQSTVTKEQFEQNVLKIKEHIYNGDIFQAVLSQRFHTKLKGDLLNVYRVLRTTNPSPYMYYLKFEDLEIAGTSPETLVKVADGTIYTCPIAGTKKRGKTSEEDEQLIKELLSDEKELAEHNMLVDLARNDVGKISKFGTVKVPEYMVANKFSHVIHITSLVTGILDEQCDTLSVLESIFPAGTLSGAPKIKAIHLIDELEKTSRGIYGGAIGYIDFSGNLDMCIAIRTIVKNKEDAYIGVGAGIVHDSVPENEYAETINKANAMFQALEIASKTNF